MILPKMFTICAICSSLSGPDLAYAKQLLNSQRRSPLMRCVGAWWQALSAEERAAAGDTVALTPDDIALD